MRPYRVFVNGKFWGVFYARTGEGACRAARQNWTRWHGGNARIQAISASEAKD